MSCSPNQGDTSGSSYSKSTHQGRIEVGGQLLHPLFDQYKVEEMYLLDKHHLD